MKRLFVKLCTECDDYAPDPVYAAFSVNEILKQIKNNSKDIALLKKAKNIKTSFIIELTKKPIILSLTGEQEDEIDDNQGFLLSDVMPYTTNTEENNLVAWKIRFCKEHFTITVVYETLDDNDIILYSSDIEYEVLEAQLSKSGN